MGAMIEPITIIQSLPNVWAGTLKKVIADKLVANKLNPTAQPGMLLDAIKKSCDVATYFFLNFDSKEKYTPIHKIANK